MFPVISGLVNPLPTAPQFPTLSPGLTNPTTMPGNTGGQPIINQIFHGHPPPAQPVGLAVSMASTQLWPSDEQYSNSSSGSLEVPERPPPAITLPIQKLPEMTDLEHAISSMQQYECLLGHLQVLTLRHQGNLSEMFRHFIADSVLSYVGFARLKGGKYDYAMRDHFPRIVSAIKSAWFPDRNRETFEAQMELLLKNSHARHKQNARRNPLVEIQQELPLQQHPQTPAPTVNAAAAVGQNLTNQWYQYAIYYRDRYQIAKKENQKLKAHQEVSRRRVSRCLRKMNRLRQHVDDLEQRIDEMDDG